MARFDEIAAFEAKRSALIGLAYRILGSRADAEDAVQDTFLKWREADHALIENPAAWLTTACTRRCLDLLRAAHRTRVHYVGAWLPEPIHTPVEDESDRAASVASTLTTAFLLMLERLTPKERAAYLLYEIFEMPYPEIAATLELQEPACRKLVSRAKAHIDRAKVRHVTPLSRQDELLAAFETAVATGVTAPLAALLSTDIRLAADGGGKVPAALDPILGREAVLGFVAETLRGYWADYRRIETDINGGRGLVLVKDAAIVGVVSFAFDEAGQVTDIFIVRNPEKLAGLGHVIH